MELGKFLPLLVCIVGCLHNSQALNRDSSEEVLLMMMVEETWHYLNIAKIISEPVEDGEECGFACAANPKCFSYNLEASISLNGTRQCELLPSDRYNNSEKFIKSQRFHHYSIRSQCSSGPCQNSGACVSQYDTDSYVCVCAIGFTGKDCLINIDDCKNDPCQNNGTCIDRVNGFDCRCPTGFSGSRCELEIGISINSTILSNNTDYLRNLSHFLTPFVGKTSRWLLCHRASTHGWAASTFHTRCDNINHTVTIIKNGQYVFGGYNDIPWESSGGWTSTSEAFIFSLRNKEGLTPFKSPVTNPTYAIFRQSDCGPTFGGGFDICIRDNANSNTKSYTNFGSSYSIPSGVKDRNTILAGTFHFAPDEVEVFHLR